MKKVKTHFWILTLIYAVILVWGILLKMNRLRVIERNFAYMIKLDLFSRLTYSLNPLSMHATTVKENLLNVIAFMPFGFLSAAAVRKGALLKASAASLLLSLLFDRQHPRRPAWRLYAGRGLVLPWTYARKAAQDPDVGVYPARLRPPHSRRALRGWQHAVPSGVLHRPLPLICAPQKRPLLSRFPS